MQGCQGNYPSGEKFWAQEKNEKEHISRFEEEIKFYFPAPENSNKFVK